MTIEIQDDLNKQLIKAATKGKVEEISALLEKGADVNCVDKPEQQQTPLMFAACNGHTDCVSLLLENGAEVNAVNIDIDNEGSAGFTALMLAACRKHQEIVKNLLESDADIFLRNNAGESAINMAQAVKGNYTVINLLREATARDEIIFCTSVSNRVLEEAYNFKRLERMTMLRNGAGGTVESFTRERFSEVKDEAALRKAFDEHVRRGGKTETGAVFPGRSIVKRLPALTR